MSASTGGAREVVVPHAVMHALEIPLRSCRSSLRARRCFRRTGCRPAASPPYQSLVGRRLRQVDWPSSSSPLIGPQTLTLPVYAQESFSHVSLPDSPGRGIACHSHSCLPVRTSIAADVARAASPSSTRTRGAVDVGDVRPDHDDVAHDDAWPGPPGERLDAALLSLAEIDLATVAELRISLSRFSR